MGKNSIYVDLIIPTKDNDQQLEKCLDNLAKKLAVVYQKFIYSVIIIRQYDSKKVPKTFFDIINKEDYKHLNITYVTPKKHQGYIKSINLGIKAALTGKRFRVKQSSYIGFLHDDTIVFRNFVDDLVSILQKNDDIYGCGSITYNKCNKQCISNTYKLFDLKQAELKKFQNINDQNFFKLKQFSKKQKYYKFTEQNDTNISLFGSIFKISTFSFDNLFNENLLTDEDAQNQFFNRLIKNEKYLALALNSFVSHKCSSYKKHLNNLEAAKLNTKIKQYFNNSKNKNVVYSFLQPEDIQRKIVNFKKQDNIQYVCFTTNDSFYQKDNWTIIGLNKFLNIEKLYDINDLKEYVKLHPLSFFENFQKFIWIDLIKVNYLTNNLSKFINQNITDQNSFLTFSDLQMDCSWKYLLKLYNTDKISKNQFQKIISLYQFTRFDQKIGLMDTSLMIFLNKKRYIKIFQKIWLYYMTLCKNDKLWFNLSFWLLKTNFSVINRKK